MEENYSLNLMVIVDEPIELSDLFKRVSEAKIDGFKLEPPEINVGNIPTSLMITTGTPSFRIQKVINGYDLLIFNVIHSDAKRGGFQIEIPNINGLTIAEELYNKLWEFVQSLNYTKVYAYEISINFIIKQSRYLSLSLLNDLQTTMKSPKFASIRIIDGDLEVRDLREEFISEIRIDALSQPMKSKVGSMYRFKNFEKNKLQEIFSNIDKVLSLVK